MSSLRRLLIPVAVLLAACGGTDEPTDPAGGSPYPQPPAMPGSPADPATPTAPGTPTDGTPTDGTPTDGTTPSTPTDPSTPGTPSTPPGSTPPATPAPPPPTSTTGHGHLVPGCVPDLFVINVGNVPSTCDDQWFVGADVIQILFKDNNGTPSAGRTYTVVSQSQVNIYPADGEVTAVYLPGGGGGQGANSGTVTIDPVSVPGNLSGSYYIELASKSVVTGTFRADVCSDVPEDCE